MVNLIVDHPRIDVNSTGKFNRTPLHYAVASPHIVGLLLKRNDIEVKAKDCDGNTPLQVAVSYCNIKTARMLLQYKRVSWAEKNLSGQTALHLAVKALSGPIAKLLLEKGDYKINDCDNKDRTVVHWLALSLEFWARCNELVQDLKRAMRGGRLKSFEDIKNCFNDRWSKKVLSLVLIIMEHDPKLTCQDKEGNTPLHLACRHNIYFIDYVLVLKALLKVNKKEETPFHASVIRGTYQQLQSS